MFSLVITLGPLEYADISRAMSSCKLKSIRRPEAMWRADLVIFLRFFIAFKIPRYATSENPTRVAGWSYDRP